MGSIKLLTMKQNTLTCCLLLFLILDLASCRSQVRANSERDGQVSFLKRYNARFNNQDLLLGCIVYAEESIRPLSIDSSGEFYKITTIFQDDVRINADPDSLINDFLIKHATVDFSSDKTMFKIKTYIECYRVPEILKIYRLYVPEGNYLGSLSSSGVALYVQIAYYLSTLDIYKRNEVLKSLL